MLLKFTFGTIIEYTIIKLYYHQRMIIMQPKQIKYKQKKKGFCLISPMKSLIVVIYKD